MRLAIWLPGGKLKLKTYRSLRNMERNRKVPLFKLGGLHLIWWSAGNDKRFSGRM